MQFTLVGFAGTDAIVKSDEIVVAAFPATSIASMLRRISATIADAVSPVVRYWLPDSAVIACAEHPIPLTKVGPVQHWVVPLVRTSVTLTLAIPDPGV